MAVKLGDIIEIPLVKLVIELNDACTDPEGIVSTFVFTEEVAEEVGVILERIGERRGSGIFVKGNFGSGKTHLLSYLYLLLSGKATPKIPSLIGYASLLGERQLNVQAISLIKYPASRTLEEIVAAAFGYDGKVTERDGLFKSLFRGDTVIIIDELSEFLRSKPTPSAFYEDVRFLQFLGEFSFQNPLWIIATLQEWIEETGHVSSTIFNRIKDRFLIRVTLTSSHIEDVIDRRMIIKKPGAIAVMEEVFAELRKYYPGMPLKFGEFKKTYPLHPITVRYLSGLTPVFSQHRGAIHFVMSEVKKILDSPCDVLVTPESIFDHFEDRIREIPQYSRLVTVAYDYYKVHMEEIMREENQKRLMETAFSALKIMALTEISPHEKRKTYKELAEMLLKKISTLNRQINYEFIRDGILEPLAAHQMYVVKDGDTYYLDPKVDEGLLVKGKVKALRERFADKSYLFTQMCQLTRMPYLPLRDIEPGVSGGKNYRFTWQNSQREVHVAALSPAQFKFDEVERLLISTVQRIDGLFIILSPSSDARPKVKTFIETLHSTQVKSLILWVPRPFSGEEELFVEEFIARHALSGEYPHLVDELKREEAIFRDFVGNAYFSGEIAYGSGSAGSSLKDVGYLPMERLLGYLFDQVFAELHPYHHKIMPRTDYYSSHHLNLLFAHFIKHGKITIEESEKLGITPYVKGLLEPLGIVKKRSTSYVVSMDAENELVSHLLNLLGEQEDPFELRVSLKKGKWGLVDAQVGLLLSAAVATGYAAPFRGDEMVELKEFSQLATSEISRLSPGKTLSPHLLEYVSRGNFIWGEVEDVPTPLTQKAMWKETVERVRKTKKLLEETNVLITRYKDYSIFRTACIERDVLDRLGLFTSSITMSLAPAEGIERMLVNLRESPDLREDVNYLESLHQFLTENFNTINKHYLYLNHLSLRLPTELEALKTSLLSRIKGLLGGTSRDYDAVNAEWDNFYSLFTEAYREGHRQYYQSAVFKIRKEVEDAPLSRVLKNISAIVRSVAFDCDWWQIGSSLDGLPDSCRADLSYELFINPVCKCGYKIGDTKQTSDVDFLKQCETGILNFLTQLQLPEQRERLETYVMGMGGDDEALSDNAGRIQTLLGLNVGTVNVSLVLPLLNGTCLEEIEQALKGRWKIKEVTVDDFLKEVRGRRLKYGQLRDVFQKWAGNEENSIVWIKGEEFSVLKRLKVDFSKYGSQGERIIARLSHAMASQHIPPDDDGIEELMGREGYTDLINWKNYSTEELIVFLDSETVNVFRSRLREEVFYKHWGKGISNGLTDATGDELLGDLLRAIRLSEWEGRYRGGELFTKVIAPMSLIVEKVKYLNAAGNDVDDGIINRVATRFTGIVKAFEKSPGKMDGIGDMAFVGSAIRGTVVVLDGLRYDLWLFLKEDILRTGRVVKDSPYFVPYPSTTNNFRKLLGIDDGGGNAIGERAVSPVYGAGGDNFSIIKWAEHGGGKRGLKKLLKEDMGLKIIHFNFIDTKIHGSAIDLYPLYTIIRNEFRSAIMPILDSLPSFVLLSDHGFVDAERLKDRYVHGGTSVWETILPYVEIV